MEAAKSRYWETGKCPKCGEEIEKEVYRENRGDMMLFPIYEEINTFYCPVCGWTDRE